MNLCTKLTFKLLHEQNTTSVNLPGGVIIWWWWSRISLYAQFLLQNPKKFYRLLRFSYWRPFQKRAQTMQSCLASNQTREMIAFCVHWSSVTKSFEKWRMAFGD